MAKLTFILDKKSVDSFGRSQIKIRIVAGDSNTSIRTGMYVPEKVFVGNPDAVVLRTYASARTINKEMAELYYQYLNVIMEIDKRGMLQHMSAAEIRDYARRQKECHVERTFTSTLQEYKESCRTEKTKGTYDYATQLMERCFGKNKFFFEEINYKFLTDFDRWMEQNGIGISSRGVVFRNIRTIYNYAIKNDWVNYGLYPFRKFKIKTSTKEKEFMPIELFRKMQELPLSGGKAFARDIFALSFMFCGANPIDLFNMAPAKDNVVTFVRTKVAHTEPMPIHITIQPEAQHIIDRYKGKDHLLNLAEHYVCYDYFKRFLNTGLEKIGREDLGLSKCYPYLARYSWATYADYLDISERIVGKALGHKGTSLADSRYISFDWSKVDRANRRVIDYAFYNKE